MPSTTFLKSDLYPLLGRKLGGEELRSAILSCKGEVEEEDREEIKLEIKDSNRIDLLSTEGLARTLKGYLGMEKGLPQYSSSPANIDINVDPSVARVRPYVVAFSATGMELTDEILSSYMNLQEKMHTTHGRGRARMAIGFYDLDLISPPIRYTLTPPDQNSFIPLEGSREMSPSQILEEHPKGREFSHLVDSFERYPILLDANDQVLSMPPIINSNTLGRVTDTTRNLFVEATGTDFSALSLGLNVLATALADRGAAIGSVNLLYKDGTRKTPDFSNPEAELQPSHCNQILGLELQPGDILDLLLRARFDARMEKNRIRVTIPCYRADIMHENDLIEEVAIMYGYQNMDPIEPQIPTIGRTNPLQDFSDLLRELAIGLGFQEVMTFVLTSPQNITTRMGDREIEYVEIENPTTRTFSVFRPDLLPSLLEFLANNTHVPYPQRVFESGDAVVRAGPACETHRKLCLVWAQSKVNFTEMKGVIEAFTGSLDIDYELKPLESPTYIEGRAARLSVDGRGAGVFGEIHPSVLESWQIPVPVLAGEFDSEILFEAIERDK